MMSVGKRSPRAGRGNLKEDFFRRLAANEHGEGLFDYIPEVLFFIKDTSGRFITGNRQVLDRFNLKSESELVGKTDFDLVPKYLAENYFKDDLYVMTSGNAIVNKIEMVMGPDKMIDWYTTYKIPLRDTRHRIIGLAGITRYHHEGDASIQPYVELSKVLDYMQKNFTKPLRVCLLAHLGNLSLSAFERKFRKLFSVTPRRYILLLRVKEACHKLTGSDVPIAELALELGFSDQSHFTREFRKIMGVNPRRYRLKQWAGGQSAADR